MKHPSAENSILSLLGIFMLPIILLNWLGGVVGGIWLLLNGNASLAILGLAFLLFETWVLSFLLMPGFGLAALGVSLYDKNHRFSGSILMALNWVYDVLLISTATYFIFEVVLNNWKAGSIIPVLLLAYTLASGPWTYMAAHEPDDGGYNASVTTVFFIDIGVIGTMILLYLGHALIYSFWPMRICMLLLLIVQIIVVFIISKDTRSSLETIPKSDTKRREVIEGQLIDEELHSWDSIK